MIISPSEVLDRIAEGVFLAGLGARDAHNPEGAGFDLRLAQLHALEGAGALGVAERKTPQATGLDLDGSWYTLAPSTYYLATTVETFNTPDDVAALVVPRSTLYRSGIVMSGGLVAPGYEGAITVGLYNATPSEFRIEVMARFLHVIFLAMSSAGNPYGGQWQGGRIAAPESETQN